MRGERRETVEGGVFRVIWERGRKAHELVLKVKRDYL